MIRQQWPGPLLAYAVVSSSEPAGEQRGSAAEAEVVPTSTPSGRGVQLSLPHFTPVIFHPNAREAPASDWVAAAEAHAAPERTSPTLPAIPNTTMRAMRRSGYVVAEMLVAATAFVTLAVR
jgi:hypothetical protein